ncbi:hypothetical protein C8R43DRAFT_893918 [Mycena crocata]|nr:hypothetical protein C8R43DRAFT_893918 [Mycena crocata]
MAPRTQRVVQWTVYQTMLSQFRTDKRNFIFLNIGCGFGDVTYRAIQDGIPVAQTLSVDKDRNLWLFGKRAFSFAGPPPQTAPFVEGDLFDERFLPRLSHADSPFLESISDLASLQTLSPLRRRVSAIFAERLFSLFPFEQQEDLAARLAPLLMQRRGAMIFGRQRAGEKFETVQDGDGLNVFLHSPESWRAMWAGVFPEGTVKLRTELISRPSDPKSSNLWWSVVSVVRISR